MIDSSYNLPNILQQLIDYNLELRERVRNRCYRMMSAKQWAEQFCTIRVDVGRQSGKSWYCAISCDDTGVIIVPNHQLAKFHLNPRAVSKSSYHQYRTELHNIRYVFIEEPSQVQNLNDIYTFFTMDCIERTFILIGT